MLPSSRVSRPPQALLLVPLLFLLLLTPSLGTPVSLQVPLFPNFLPPPTLRGVDDVGPAFANATEAALAKAEAILAQYSNVLRIVAIPTGLAVTFFGYFLLGPVLFLAGFISGGGACFIAVNAAIGDSTPAAAWIAIVAMLLGGAMLGFLALHALNFGMFAVGAALGVVLSSALKTSLIAQAYPADPDLAFMIAAAVCGLVFGILAVCLQKQMLIFSTAYAGSCACMFGIGHFAGHFPTTMDITNVEQGKVDAWVLFYIILTLLLGTTGMFFQFWLGKGKPMPTHAPHDRRRRRQRVQQQEADEWSDFDEQWGDELYVERAPLPRAKQHAQERPDLQTDIHSNQQSFKADHMPLPRRSPYTQQSWNNVRSASTAFDDDDSAQSSDAASGAAQIDSSEQPKEVESQAPMDKPETEVQPTGNIEADLFPETKVAIEDASEVRAVAKDSEPADKLEDTFDHGHHPLVSVSLESDVETVSEKQ